MPEQTLRQFFEEQYPQLGAPGCAGCRAKVQEQYSRRGIPNWFLRDIERKCIGDFLERYEDHLATEETNDV